MLRSAVIAAFLLSAGTALAETPTLKGSVNITGDIVRIGDLIEHAGAFAKIAVFRSPDLGTSGAVDVDSILDALRPYSLPAIDTRGLSEVVVTRESRIVAVEDIRAAIAAAIARQALSVQAKDLAISFDSAPQPIQVEATAKSDLQVPRVQFNARTGRFDAALEIPGAGDSRRFATRVTGTAVITAEAVVLARSVERGEVLRASDVAIERRARTDFGADGFVSADSVVGMAARRTLSTGQMLRAADLMKPDLVNRNDLVTLVFEVPGVSVSTRGKASSSGAEGDTVSVTNLETKRVIQGTVTGYGIVTVQPSAAAAAANGPTDPTITGTIRRNPVRTEIIRPTAEMLARPKS